jgi:hypothetical protein
MVTLMRLENDKIDLQKIMFKDLISNFNKKKQLIRKIEDIELIVENDEIEIFQQFDPFGEIPPQIISIPRLGAQILRMISSVKLSKQ